MPTKFWRSIWTLKQKEGSDIDIEGAFPKYFFLHIRDRNGGDSKRFSKNIPHSFHQLTHDCMREKWKCFLRKIFSICLFSFSTPLVIFFHSHLNYLFCCERIFFFEDKKIYLTTHKSDKKLFLTKLASGKKSNWKVADSLALHCAVDW